MWLLLLVPLLLVAPHPITTCPSSPTSLLLLGMCGMFSLVYVDEIGTKHMFILMIHQQNWMKLETTHISMVMTMSYKK
jgi:hypothetical protein